MTRDQAIKIICKNSNNIRPKKDIESFCKLSNISLTQFDKFAEKFRNKDIWKKNKLGKWEIKNFITKSFIWK